MNIDDKCVRPRLMSSNLSFLRILGYGTSFWIDEEESELKSNEGKLKFTAQRVQLMMIFGGFFHEKYWGMQKTSYR